MHLFSFSYQHTSNSRSGGIFKFKSLAFLLQREGNQPKVRGKDGMEVKT